MSKRFLIAPAPCMTLFVSNYMEDVLAKLGQFKNNHQSLSATVKSACI